LLKLDHTSIYPLGDSAVTLDLGNRIDEALHRKALAIREWLLLRQTPGITDIIVSYSAVSVLYDPVLIRKEAPGDLTAFDHIREKLEEACHTASPGAASDTEIIRVPVCYTGEFAPDLPFLSENKQMSPSELIALHSSGIYRVYMIGFLPGFAYLGKLNPRLETPRKIRPVPVMAGSVGIAGNQAGIYPLNSPGGWHILGRTPLKMFDPEKEMPIRLRTGDRVQFTPITTEEFREMAAKPVS
jgi:inhibitor of KinA